MQDKTQSLRFADWNFSPQSGELWCKDQSLTLTNIQKQLLSYLLHSESQVKTREDIIAHVWKDKIVNEEALSRLVAELRKALGDSATAPKFIKTIPKTGYQFIEEVVPLKKLKKTRTWQISVAVILLLFLLAILLKPANPIKQLLQDLQNSSRLIAESGMEHHSILSEDGEQLMFTKLIEGESAIVITSVNDISHRKVIRKPGSHLQSPVWITDTEIAALATSNQQCFVFTYDMTDSRWNHLSSCVAHGESRMLTADSKNKILYFVDKNPGGLTAIKSLQLDKQISTWLTEPNIAESDYSPALSPDGKRLSFSRGDQSTRNLMVIHPETAELEPLTFGNHYSSSHTWLNDEIIVLDFDKNGTRELWALHIESKELSPLGKNGILHPSFDKNRSLMTYQSVNYEANIWSIDIESGNVGKLIGSTRYDNYPAFAPDGKSFLFSSNRQDIGSIWSFDFETQQETKILAIDGAKLTRPSWHPDGKKIYVTANDHRGFWSLEYDLQKETFKKMMINSKNSWAQASKNSIYALIHDSQHPSQLVELKSQQKPQLLLSNVSRFMPAESGCILFTQIHEPGIFQKCPDHNPVALIPEFPQSKYNHWTLSAPFLYYVESAENSAQKGIWRQNIYSFEQEFIAPYVPSAVGGVISVSPDNKTILIANTDRVDSDIYKVGLSQ